MYVSVAKWLKAYGEAIAMASIVVISINVCQLISWRNVGAWRNGNGEERKRRNGEEEEM